MVIHGGADAVVWVKYGHAAVQTWADAGVQSRALREASSAASATKWPSPTSATASAPWRNWSSRPAEPGGKGASPAATAVGGHAPAMLMLLPRSGQPRRGIGRADGGRRNHRSGGRATSEGDGPRTGSPRAGVTQQTMPRWPEHRHRRTMAPTACWCAIRPGSPPTQQMSGTKLTVRLVTTAGPSTSPAGPAYKRCTS